LPPPAQREHVLCALVPRCSGEQRSTAVKSAFDAAVESEYPYHLNSEQVVGWFCSFGEHLPDEFLAGLVGEARTIYDVAQRTRSLVRVALLEHGLIPGLRQEAIEAARRLGEPALRAQLLAQLAAFLQPELIDLALLESSEISSPTARAAALAALADHLSDGRRRETYYRALVAIRDAKGERDASPHAVLRRMLPELPSELFGEALSSALTLDYLHGRQLVLRELGDRYPPALVEALVSDGEHPEKVAADCAAALSDDELVSAWSRLLHYLAQGPRASAVVKLGSAAPIIAACGGENGVQAVYESLQQVARSWP